MFRWSYGWRGKLLKRPITLRYLLLTLKSRTGSFNLVYSLVSFLFSILHQATIDSCHFLFPTHQHSLDVINIFSVIDSLASSFTSAVNMHAKTFILLSLAAIPFVTAHGKIASVTGDTGGNGTALAIKGGVVPGPGPNSKVRSVCMSLLEQRANTRRNRPRLIPLSFAVPRSRRMA